MVVRNFQRQLLRRLRWLAAYIRLFALADGMAVFVIWLCLAFWTSLGLDWLMEWPVGIRGAFFAGAVAASLILVYRLILHRFFARLSNRGLATILERRFEQFKGSLLTAVEESSRSVETGPLHRKMVEATAATAFSHLPEAKLQSVFRWRPLGRRILSMILLMATILVFAGWRPETVRCWYSRNILMAGTNWPRKTRLAIEGFENGTIKMARGDDLSLLVRADASKLIPEIVQIRYEGDDGSEGRENLSKQGNAVPGLDRFQEYVHTFRGVLSSFNFSIRGGDDRIEDLRVEIVDSPIITDLRADVEYPEYTGVLPAFDVPAAASLEYPAGSRIVLRGTTNKDLRAMRIERIAATVGDADLQGTDIPRSGEREFAYDLGPVTEDQSLRLFLTDTDGITSRSPLQLAIRALPDEPPEVAFELRGIGTAVTPKARLPFVGNVSDDYGVSKAWIAYQVADEPEGEFELDRSRGREQISAELELSTMSLSPGQELLAGVSAVDNCALESGPNRGHGQRYSLKVVTAHQLRAMLEARELVLRRQLESIVERMADVRDTLEMIDSSRMPVNTSSSRIPVQASFTVHFGKTLQSASPFASTSVADEETILPSSDSTARVQQSLQASRRAAQEVIDLADAFVSIRAELANNRIDAQGLDARISEGIEQPLRKVGEDLFPVLVQQLVELNKQISGNGNSQSLLMESRQQANEILAELTDVLGKMAELEDFQELLDMLREIINAQDSVTENTEERRKQKVLELLQE